MKGTSVATLGAALLIGVAVAAGAQGRQPQDSTRARTEQRVRGDRMGDRGFGRFDRGPGRRHGRRGGRGFGAGAFLRDLNLTDAQRTQIRAIHDKYRPQLETIRKDQRTQMDNVRSLRQKGDTAGARRAFEQNRTALRTRLEGVHKQMLAEVRNVLTADQRAKFDARQTEMQKRREEFEKRREEWQKNGGGRRGGKYGRGPRA